MNKFQIFCWILVEICLKCINLVTNVQKSSFWFWWPEVAWFGQIAFF